jgi:hypothetical protein
VLAPPSTQVAERDENHDATIPRNFGEMAHCTGFGAVFPPFSQMPLKPYAYGPKGTVVIMIPNTKAYIASLLQYTEWKPADKKEFGKMTLGELLLKLKLEWRERSSNSRTAH